MKQYYEALFLSYRPRTTECSISQYCDTNCYSGRSKHAWALAVNRWKNFQNHLYGQPVLTFTVLAVASVWTNINRVTLQHNKEFIVYFFILKWFNMRHFEYSRKRSLLNDWKQSAQRFKLKERLLTINKRKLLPEQVDRFPGDVCNSLPLATKVIVVGYVT